MKQALKRHGRAEAIVTGGIRSCPAAMCDLGNLDRREMDLPVDNRALRTAFFPFDEVSVRYCASGA